jgi:hypothetical protein
MIITITPLQKERRRGESPDKERGRQLSIVICCIKEKVDVVQAKNGKDFRGKTSICSPPP